MISRGLKQGKGAGQPKEKKTKKGISRCLKRLAGRANIRKKEKTNGLVGTKNRGRGRPTLGEKRKNGLVGAKNRGRVGPT